MMLAIIVSSGASVLLLRTAQAMDLWDAQIFRVQLSRSIVLHSSQNVNPWTLRMIASTSRSSLPAKKANSPCAPLVD